MKDIFLLNSGARPFIPNRFRMTIAPPIMSSGLLRTRAGCSHTRVSGSVLWICGMRLLRHTQQHIFSRFWWNVSHSAGSSQLKSDWIVEPTRLWRGSVVVARERWRWEGWMSNSSDAGAWIPCSTVRFEITSTCSLLCQRGYFWCGCQVSPASPHLTVACNKTRGYLSNRVDSSGQWESDRRILWFTEKWVLILTIIDYSSL